MKKIFVFMATALVAISANAQVQAVDLGLPSGLKWGDRYVGASAPETVGEYYAYGETSPKTSFTDDNYEYRNASFVYYDSVNGHVYFNTTTPDVKDVATEKLGNGWHTPTQEEITELFKKCKVTVVKTAGNEKSSATIKITGLNGKSINLVTTGYYDSATNRLIIPYYLYIRTSTMYQFSKSESSDKYYSPLPLEIAISGTQCKGRLITQMYDGITSGLCVLPVYSESTAIENTTAESKDQSAICKFIESGKVKIVKNGIRYNAVGQRIN